MKQNIKGERTCNRIIHCSKWCSSCIPSCILLIAATEHRAQVSTSLGQGTKPHLHPYVCACKRRLCGIFWPRINVIYRCVSLQSPRSTVLSIPYTISPITSDDRKRLRHKIQKCMRSMIKRTITARDSE